MTDVQTRYLISGEVIISREPGRVWTVLGSCVSAVFSAPGRGLWAICHAQLPERRREGLKCADHCPNPCFKERDVSVEMRYVTCVLRFMADRFASELIPPSKIRVRLYGGSTLFQGLSSGASVGEKNVSAARATLATLGLRVSGEETGGSAGRTVLYDSVTDLVDVKIPSQNDRSISLAVEIPK